MLSLRYLYCLARQGYISVASCCVIVFDAIFCKRVHGKFSKSPRTLLRLQGTQAAVVAAFYFAQGYVMQKRCLGHSQVIWQAAHEARPLQGATEGLWRVPNVSYSSSGIFFFFNCF